MIQPKEEGDLEYEVHGDPTNEEPEGVLNDRKEGKNYPIRHPLRIVFGFARIDGFEGRIGGI